jgi:hypothetical protein
VTRLYSILLLFALLAIPAFGAQFGDRKVGMEFELLGAGQAADNTNPSNFYTLLEPAQREFRGAPIQIRAWDRYTNAKGTFYTRFTDDMGREWLGVPEQLTNDDDFDGYELVTPPLKGAEDIDKTEIILRELEASGQFVRARNSSTHYTFDISDLIGEGGDYSRVIDLILYLESNILETYRKVKPVRYGHVINSYAVPLGLNQKELLHKLAKLPRDKRTYTRIRDIFFSYERAEAAMTWRNTATWKYRAISYRKLFALKTGTTPLPVIEFRLADLQTANSFRATGAYFTGLIEAGSRDEVSEFADPFPGFKEFLPGTADQRRLDSFVMGCDAWLK